MKLGPRATATIVSAVILALGGGGFALWQFTSAPDRNESTVAIAPIAYLWPSESETLAYRITIATTGAADLAGLEAHALGKHASGERNAAPQQLDSNLQLTLALRFVPTASGSFLVHAKASRISYVVNGADAYLPSHFDRPFLFAIDSHGCISDFEFAEGLKSAAMAALRSACETLQAVMTTHPRRDSKDQLRWETVEAELRGESVWESVIDIGDTKSHSPIRRLRKSLRSPTNDSARSVTTVVTRSAYEVMVVPRRPWIESVRGDESLSFRAGDRELGTSHTVVTVVRDTVPSETAPPQATSELRASLATKELRIAALAETDPRLDPQTKSLSLDEMRDWFLENYAANPGRASDTLLNWLRQDPSRAGPLTDWIAANGAAIETVVADQIWWAIVASGSPRAMEAFTRMLRDPGATDYALLKMVGHAHGFPNPNRPLADALWHLWHERDRSEGLRRTASHSALLALGSLGSHDKLNPSLGRAIAQELADEIHRATSPTDKERFLEAIANHGSSSLIPTIERQLVDTDPNIRARAFEAMRSMPPLETDDVMFRNIERESSASVRAAAYDAISAHPTPARIDHAAQRAPLEADPLALRAIVRVLGAGLADPATEPASRQALRDLLSRRPPMPVRNEIYKFLEP